MVFKIWSYGKLVIRIWRILVSSINRVDILLFGVALFCIRDFISKIFFIISFIIIYILQRFFKHSQNILILFFWNRSLNIFITYLLLIFSCKIIILLHLRTILNWRNQYSLHFRGYFFPRNKRIFTIHLIILYQIFIIILVI